MAGCFRASSQDLQDLQEARFHGFGQSFSSRVTFNIEWLMRIKKEEMMVRLGSKGGYVPMGLSARLIDVV